MIIPPSNPAILAEIVDQIKDLDLQLEIACETLAGTERQLREIEHNHQQAMHSYENLRLMRRGLLCKLRGVDVESATDPLSSPLYEHLWRKLSEGKIRKLKEAGITYIGDLAQAKVIRNNGRPLSLHPLLPSGEHRIAGVPVIGRKTIAYLEGLLKEHGLTFEMRLTDWFRPLQSANLLGATKDTEEILNMEAWLLLRKTPYGTPYQLERHRWNNDSPTYFVGDLVRMSERDVLKLKFVGPKQLGHIKQLLSDHSLSLGMSLPDWVRPQETARERPQRRARP